MTRSCAPLPPLVIVSASSNMASKVMVGRVRPGIFRSDEVSDLGSLGRLTAHGTVTHIIHQYRCLNGKGFRYWRVPITVHSHPAMFGLVQCVLQLICPVSPYVTT